MREVISSVRKWMGPQSPRKLSPCASLDLDFVWVPRILYKCSKIVHLYQNGSVSHLSDFIVKAVFKMSWEIHTHLYASQCIGDKEIYVFHKFWKLTIFFLLMQASPQDSASWGKQLIIFSHYGKPKSAGMKCACFYSGFPLLPKYQLDEIIAIQLVIPLWLQAAWSSGLTKADIDYV